MKDTYQHPHFTSSCNVPRCAMLLLVPLCPVATEGHDNYGKNLRF